MGIGYRFFLEDFGISYNQIVLKVEFICGKIRNAVGEQQRSINVQVCQTLFV